jgi:hypothetical protein
MYLNPWRWLFQQLWTEVTERWEEKQTTMMAVVLPLLHLAVYWLPTTVTTSVDTQWNTKASHVANLSPAHLTPFGHQRK